MEVLWQSCGSLEIKCPGNDAIRSSIAFENNTPSTLNLTHSVNKSKRGIKVLAIST